jgi:hypothetical protein
LLARIILSAAYNAAHNANRRLVNHHFQPSTQSSLQPICNRRQCSRRVTKHRNHRLNHPCGLLQCNLLYNATYNATYNTANAAASFLSSPIISAIVSAPLICRQMLQRTSQQPRLLFPSSQPTQQPASQPFSSPSVQPSDRLLNDLTAIPCMQPT